MLDAIVVGAGHAGVEAALALARSHKKTCLVTLNFSHISKMPCNPSIGGPAKGVVVREIDALGGQMAKVADLTALQFKMLNTAKGPGVQSLRVQSDKLAYSENMRAICEKTPNLEMLEDIVDEVLVEKEKAIGVRLRKKGILNSRVVVLTTGTYMDSTIMISADTKSSGPDGDPTSRDLSFNLKKLGFKLIRLKTGTPPRVLTSSIDFSKTQKEVGTDAFLRFSEESENLLPFYQQVPCYLTYTNQQTHDIIRANLNLSSMYSGVVKGIGPRYCPSIEDKVVRFADKLRHQIFLEPQSLRLDTTYVQGFSSSLPQEVQAKMLKTLPGLEKAIIKRYAYAIEYDAFDPLQIKANLETKKIKNLFIAGQILGTSGYEEAAGLGLVAGINAVLALDNKEPFILRRDESYIGVMIDDLITKGTNEPYRLLTSRAEYRLLLRHDNAEERLIKYGYGFGLVSEKRYQKFLKKHKQKAIIKEEIKELHLSATLEVNNYLLFKGFNIKSGSYSVYELCKRPNINLKDLFNFLGKEINEELLKQIEIEIKYDGYISKAVKQAQRMYKIEMLRLPSDVDYNKVDNLRLEARQKLNLIKPATLGQAARISGLNPADIQVLAIHLKKNNF